MKKIVILLLLFCLSLLADKQTTLQDSNITDASSSTSNKNSIPNKIVNFFGGIVDDIREFAVDNNIIDKSKRNAQ